MAILYLNATNNGLTDGTTAVTFSAAWSGSYGSAYDFLRGNAPSNYYRVDSQSETAIDMKFSSAIYIGKIVFTSQGNWRSQVDVYNGNVLSKTVPYPDSVVQNTDYTLVIDAVVDRLVWRPAQSGAGSLGYPPYANRFKGFDTTPISPPPNAPTNLSPSGTSTVPANVHSVTPTLSWAFSDPTSGNTQSAYQLQIFNASGSLLFDTAQVNSSSNSFAVPGNLNLQQGTLYSWTVRTWNNKLIVGAYTVNQYFKTSNAPTVTNLTPGNVNSATPDTVSNMPKLSWIYSDADGDAQSSYQVRAYNASTNGLAYDSQQILSSNTYHSVPSGVLGTGLKYYWNVTVFDTTNLSTTSSSAYIIADTPPQPLVLSSPLNTYRVGLRPVFVATIGDDLENSKQDFKIQLAEDINFTVNLQERVTSSSQIGWEVNNGSAWLAFPSGGVDASFEGKQVRYTWQIDLTEGKTYYWRMAPIDGVTGVSGSWSLIRTIRVGDTLQFKLKNPVKTAGAAKKLLLTGKRQIATDGTTAASLKVEVCNNGLDASPTWEDATNAFLNGLYYSFTNSTKTAADWAVDARVTIKANDSLGAIEFDGFGFTIQ